MKKTIAVSAASVASRSGSGYPEPFNTTVGSAIWRPPTRTVGPTEVAVCYSSSTDSCSSSHSAAVASRCPLPVITAVLASSGSR